MAYTHTHACNEMVYSICVIISKCQRACLGASFFSGDTRPEKARGGGRTDGEENYNNNNKLMERKAINYTICRDPHDP